MVIKEVHYQPAYHYELQTYVEKRETNWTYAPHKGGSINGPSHGRAPLPWEIVEEPTSMFKDEVRIVSIPHTDVIKACHKCRGTGGMTCRECSGKVGLIVSKPCRDPNLFGINLVGLSRSLLCSTPREGGDIGL